MGYRHRGRQRAMQCLYQWQVTGRDVDRCLDLFWQAHSDLDEVRAFATELVRGTVENIELIDTLIVEQASNWRPDRMGIVDRSILRLGVYELTTASDVPAAVAIDEAIELAKRFVGERAGQFINGVLDGVRKRLDSRGAGAGRDLDSAAPQESPPSRQAATGGSPEAEEAELSPPTAATHA